MSNNSAPMGTAGLSPWVLKVEKFFQPIFLSLPGTYRHYIVKLVNRYPLPKLVLDAGTGDGTFFNLLFPSHRYPFTVDGVEIFTPYARKASATGRYRRIYSSSLINFIPSHKYHLVFFSHVLEHLTSSQGLQVIKTLEAHCSGRVIIICPQGHAPQGEYDANRFQRHVSSWTIRDLEVLGYRCRTFGFKPLWGDRDIIRSYGLLGYGLFVLSYLLQPIIFLFPQLGTYIVAYKDLYRHK